MTSAPFPFSSPQPLEDPLAYLPCTKTSEYSKGARIYNHNQPSGSIFLILRGTVKVSRAMSNGKNLVLDLYRPDEFFGESTLLNRTNPSESAVAFEEVEVMTWTVSQIKELSLKQPKLAVALMQLLANRSLDFTIRLESLFENNDRRLARSLIRFSERLGTLSPVSSATQMMPLTQDFLAQYVGSSRELISGHMRMFREKGYLQYSREGMSVNRDALKEWLRPKPL